MTNQHQLHGTILTREIYDNENLAKCLYYGWNGEKQWSGFTSREMGIVCTSLALDYFNNGKTHNVAKNFIEYLNSVSMPEIKLEFSNKDIYANLTEDKTKQKTESITVIGDSNYCITLKLQEGVIMHNETKETNSSGTVNIYGGDTFYLEAPLTICGSWISDNITNCKYKFQPIIYRTENLVKQDLASGIEVISDSSMATNITVNWISTGYIEINKFDQEDNQIKLKGVVFGIYDESDNLIDTLITNENGYCKSLPLDISKKYFVKELSTASDYKLNENVWKIKLNQNGEVFTLNIGNKHEKGNLVVYKVDSEDNRITIQDTLFDVYNSKQKLIATISTDKQGVARLDNIDTDTYFIIEKESNLFYKLNAEKYNLVVKNYEEFGDSIIMIENEKKKGTITIIKTDKNNEEIKLEGAIFGIYNEEEELITTIITDENGEGTSEKIALGKYYIKELDTGSPYYLINEEIYSIEITEDDENIPIQIENAGVNIDVSIEKKGSVEIKPGEDVNYTFSNIANLSNIYLEDFKWIDYIPADFVRLETINTGIWNQDLYYDVYYKTNIQDEYNIYKKQLYAFQNYEIDFTEIQFDEDEYITEICFDFGMVDIGFHEESMVTMRCKTLDTLENGEIFTNQSKTVGTYYEIIQEADSKWKTIVHKPEPIHEVILPRTGE